jgi:methyl-accepting chemotaxis protein
MQTHTEAPPPDTAGHTKARSIDEIIRICERAAEGDLEARLVGFEHDPEWRLLARAINRMLDTADAFVRESSAAMDHYSRDLYHRPVLRRGLKGAYRQSADIINKGGLKMKESSDQIRYVGSVATETASNVSAVAAACEELTSTSGEISHQAGDSAKLAEKAVGAVHLASLAVPKLTEATRQVNNVAKLINDIAGQTNLLALNATIEAARAGDAGKGFAVVAAEVKDLSRNTAKATDRISQQVETMQVTVKDVAIHMAAIEEAIRLVSDRTGAISLSVGEQVKATAEISRSITEVSKNAGLISERISNTQR